MVSGAGFIAEKLRPRQRFVPSPPLPASKARDEGLRDRRLDLWSVAAAAESSVHLFDSGTVSHVLSTYGYAAVFALILLESAGIPLPGETILVGAAVFASAGKGLDIRLVILTAACAAILGDNVGFWIGRTYGERLLVRFGPRVGLDARKQKLGRYLFGRFGGALVFFGRFAALLRTFAALLAGINGLRPWVFLLYNAAGGIVWATLFGVGGYMLGEGLRRITGPVGWAALALSAAGAFLAWRFYKRHEDRLLDHAEAVVDRDDAVPARGTVS